MQGAREVVGEFAGVVAEEEVAGVVEGCVC